METYLTFLIQDEYFAVQVEHVLEVLQKQRITPVPKTPAHILGIINFRGDILPVIDTRQKFNLSISDNSEKHVVIVFEIINPDESKTMIAATADSVKDVIEIQENEIKEVPELGLAFDSRYISGALHRNDNFILLLDIKKVFSAADLASVNQIQLNNNLSNNE
jgi:purine-binding chemotaxis protein CheW